MTDSREDEFAVVPEGLELAVRPLVRHQTLLQQQERKSSDCHRGPSALLHALVFCFAPRVGYFRTSLGRLLRLGLVLPLSVGQTPAASKGLVEAHMAEEPVA